MYRFLPQLTIDLDSGKLISLCKRHYFILFLFAGWMLRWFPFILGIVLLPHTKEAGFRFHRKCFLDELNERVLGHYETFFWAILIQEESKVCQTNFKGVGQSGIMLPGTVSANVGRGAKKKKKSGQWLLNWDIKIH